MKDKQEKFNKHLHSLLNRLKGLNRTYKQKNDLDFLKENMIEFPHQDYLSVTVLGYTKSGKSSVANILLQALRSVIGDSYGNDDLYYYCPVENRSFTNLVWKLCYGEKNEIVLERRNGNKEFKSIPLKEDFEDQLYEFILSLREDPAQNQHFKENYLPFVRIRLKIDALKYFEICDVPGKGETKELNEMIMKQVKQSDILMYVFESNRGKFSQMDQNYVRELKRYMETHDSEPDRRKIPLEHRIFFIGNKTDLNLSTRKYRKKNRRVRSVQSLSTIKRIESETLKSEIEDVVEILRRSVLQKLNHPTLFDGQISPDRLFFTCCDEEVVTYKHFIPEILRLRDCLIRRREGLLYKIPVILNCNYVLQQIRNSVSLLEQMSNKIRCLTDILQSFPNLERKVEELRKECLEGGLKREIGNLFKNSYDRFEEIVCDEEIDPEFVVIPDENSGANNRVNVAKRYLKNKFDTILTNEIKKIYASSIMRFQSLVFDELFRVCPQAAEVFNNNNSNDANEINDSIFNYMQFRNSDTVLPGLIESVMKPNTSNCKKLKKIVLTTALAIAAPPVLIALAPVFLLTLPFSSFAVTQSADVIFDSMETVSVGEEGQPEFEFDLPWRRRVFEELFEKFLKIEKRITKLLTSSFEKHCIEFYRDQIQNNVNTRFENLQQKRGLKKYEVECLSHALYSLEVDILSLRHEAMFENFIKQNRIGKGAFANVYAGHIRRISLLDKVDSAKDLLLEEEDEGEEEEDSEDGEEDNKEEEKKKKKKYESALACKIQRYGSERMKGEICREISLLSRYSLEHSGLVKFMSCVHDEKYKRITIFMKRYSCSLKDLICEPSIGILQRIDIARQIASTMSYLNKKGIYHRDLKPSNILTNDKMDKVFLCDFGHAKSIGMSNMCVNSVGGTQYYLDPVIQCKREFRMGLKYGLKRDVYSMGVLLAELWERERVWIQLLSQEYKSFVDAPVVLDTESNSEMFVKLRMLNDIKKEYECKNFESVRDQYQKLITECTYLIENKRPSFKKIVKTLDQIYKKLQN